MAEIKVFNLSKKEVGVFAVDPFIMDAPFKDHIVQEVITGYMATIRQGTSSTKGTSEVSGSTRKLYKQKGTGNARAGSKKGVQRRHGATQFGPKPRDYTKKINKKVQRAGMLSMLGQLIREEKIHLVDRFSLSEPKSKSFREILKTWSSNKALWVDHSEFEVNFLLSARNFDGIKLTNVNWLNVYDLVKYKQVFITTQAMTAMTEKLKPKKV